MCRHFLNIEITIEFDFQQPCKPRSYPITKTLSTEQQQNATSAPNVKKPKKSVSRQKCKETAGFWCENSNEVFLSMANGHWPSQAKALDPGKSGPANWNPANWDLYHLHLYWILPTIFQEINLLHQHFPGA